MAKKPKKLTPGQRRWRSEPDDAIRLAALRWFALTIEKVAIELYATKTSTYPRLVNILRETMTDFETLRDEVKQEDDRCPDGYILCDDGICKPSCDKLGNRDNS